jgi:two-component system sensor histidine kinase KdpD
MAVVLGITLPALFLQKVIGYRSVALIYLLGVVVLALFVERGPTLFAATLSALSWDFFFLAPIANLRIANAEDAILFGMYFVVALVLGQLTARIRAQERIERDRERRSTALYHLTRELAEATDLDELAGNAVRQMERAFSAQVAMLLPDAGATGFSSHPASSYDIAGPEQPVAQWVFEHGEPAGKFTGYASQIDTLFVPLSSGGRTLGVMGLSLGASAPPSLQQRDLLQAFSQQIALALDRQRLREQSENSKLISQSERLSKALLNSISHEIRTPLAAIKSATGTLTELRAEPLSEDQRALVDEIQEAGDRLDALVGKVLDITRLETGSVKPKLQLCDVNDLVHMAIKDTRKLFRNHKLEVELAPALPLVLADYVLLQEALKNLLANAAFHTPPGTSVRVGARTRDDALLLSIADRGPGIPPASLQRVFDKFFRGPNAPTGGTGLGLSVVKGFVEAQGGQVTAENRPDGGAVFTIRLPLVQSMPGAALENL